MASDDIEVEIKIPLDPEAAPEVIAKIKELAILKGTKHHVDEYFTPAHKNFLGFEHPYEWLRIGQRAGKTVLCYKHFYPENANVFSHCDEIETEVSCPERIAKIFDAMGARSLIIVDKERTAYIYDDSFEIAIDEVKELGTFIEIEALKDLGGIEKTREKLFDLAQLLGIEIKNVQNRGYPYLLMDKKGLLKR